MIAMFLLWAGSVPGWFGHICDESSVQKSPATHQMDSMDPQKHDADALCFIQSMKFMEHTYDDWGWPCFLCGVGQFQADLMGLWFGMKERSKWVDLHIKSTVWIHKRMILMNIIKYSPWDPWNTPKNCLGIVMFSVWAGSLPGWFWVCLGWKKGQNE
jgi:hypothetical protein